MEIINLNNLPIQDGRYVYTFTALQDSDYIPISSDCFGDTQLKKIQIERNPDMTYFVPPEVYEGNLSGIFKDLQDINIEMTDVENSSLWGRIKINSRGWLEEYHRDNISTEIVRSAEGIQAEFRNADKQLESKITSTAEGLSARIDNNADSYTSLKAIADGLQYEVSNYNGTVSSNYRQLKGLIDQRVTRNDVTSIIQQSGDSIMLAIQDKLPDEMTGEEIVSSINLTRDGIRLLGKKVRIDGDTYITNGVIKNAHISDLSASKLTAGTINASTIQVINIDAMNITGNLGRFLQILLDGVKSNVKLTGDNLDIVRKDGSYSTRFNDNGVEIWRDGTHNGGLRSLDAADSEGFYNNLKSVSLTTMEKSYLSFSYYSEQNRRYYRALALGGDGRLRIHSPLYAGTSNYGIRINQKGVTNIGNGTGIREVNGDGGFIIMENRDVYVTHNRNFSFNMSKLYDEVRELIRVNPNFVPPSDPTPSSPTGTIEVGDRVKLKDGQTTYYDENDRPVTIPTNLNGRNYRTLTYTIGYIATGKTANYRLDYEGWLIAWVRQNQIEKVM